ncbi:MAG: cytochrome c [Bacteroidia bacterium]|nr:cytochrome c [Bacteroidia bacterium]
MKPILLISAFIMLAALYRQKDLWVAPEKANTIPNPIANNNISIERGKKLFSQVCWTCHGVNGQGNGPASKALKRKPANFTDSTLQKQTDGALFWKISEGKGQMSPYKVSLTTEQRWHLVNYIRNFKK